MVPVESLAPTVQNNKALRQVAVSLISLGGNGEEEVVKHPSDI